MNNVTNRSSLDSSIVNGDLNAENSGFASPQSLKIQATSARILKGKEADDMELHQTDNDTSLAVVKSSDAYFELQLSDETVSIDSKTWELLTSKSHHFVAMGHSGFKEYDQKKIEIKEITAEAFEKILEIIRSDEKSLPSLDQNQLVEILSAATYFDMTALVAQVLGEALLSENYDLIFDYLSSGYSLPPELDPLLQEHLPPLYKLTRSDLDSNLAIAFTGKQLKLISKLPLEIRNKIKKISLELERVTDDELSYLKNFPSITHLNLSFCRNVTDGGLKYLARLDNLKYLDLYQCPQITGEGFKDLEGSSCLANLIYLNLGKCHVTDEGLSYLQNSVHLQYLNLSDCSSITREGIGFLKKITQLRYLNLYCCTKLKGLSLDLEQLLNLKWLIICHFELQDFSFLRKLTQLQYLQLVLCHFSKEYFDCLPTQLEYLGLSCSGITDKDVSTISSKLSQLKMLGVDDCRNISFISLDDPRWEKQQPSWDNFS